MSYSIWLTVDVGGPEPVALDDPLPHWNYTSNVARMWRFAMPRTAGLAGMDGMRAGEAAVELRSGIAYMERWPEVFRQWDPPNGWGDFDSQLAALRELLAGCEEAPVATVVVSR